MKRLIVTADDLGLHRGMNDGAIRAHREGIVTACSISACGRELDHAVALVQSCPELDVGIHLTLVEEAPVLPPSQIPSLVTAAGIFHRDWRVFAARYFLGRINLDEVECELRAQVERLQSKGLRLIHANGHQHLHLLPGVFDCVLRIVRDQKIGYIRTTDDSCPPGTPVMRLLPMKAMNLLGRRARRGVPGDLITCNRTIGVVAAGHQTVSSIVGLLGQITNGVTELVVHPGLGGSEISTTYDWGYEWDQETAALCDSEVREKARVRGVEIVSIGSLFP